MTVVCSVLNIFGDRKKEVKLQNLLKNTQMHTRVLIIKRMIKSDGWVVGWGGGGGGAAVPEQCQQQGSRASIKGRVP